MEKRLPCAIGVLTAALLTGCATSTSFTSETAQRPAFEEFCRDATAEQVRSRLAQGVDVNAQDDATGCTPLLAAALYNPRPDVIRTLVAAGADVHARLACRDAQVLWAGVNAEHDDVIAALGASDSTYWTPLLAAALNNPNHQVIEALIAAKADLKVRGVCECTPLIVAAAKNKNPVIVTVLAQAGAEVDAQDQFGYSALMWAAGRNPEPGIIAALASAGATINLPDREGRTALMGATDNKNVAVIVALLKAGAAVNAADVHGMSVLGYARRYGNDTPAEKLLVDNGAR